MGAITVKEFSAPAELTEVPDPQPGPGQVLIPSRRQG
jgi:NADPH:quinone reductase-like Zn-dependent oxidoreductase